MQSTTSTGHTKKEEAPKDPEISETLSVESDNDNNKDEDGIYASETEEVLFESDAPE